MARRDGRGPNGSGPRTGRGLGNCGTADTVQAGVGYGRGGGFGRGRGFGQGAGFGQGVGWQDSDATAETRELREKLERLEKEIKDLKK